MNVTSYDYIIVGGGAAGCTLASRLSEDLSKTVLLLEQGPDDKSLAIKVNGTYFQTMGTERTVEYFTEKQEYTNNREIQVMQANTLGGGHSINAMLYIRGQKEDYDGWAEAGCEGWSYEEVLPYFLKSENNLRIRNQYHGNSGPLTVSDCRYEYVMNQPYLDSACAAGKEMGLDVKVNNDFNGEVQAGAGRYQITSANGERKSTARTFLAQAQDRNNLTVRTGTSVRRVVINQGRAEGVEIQGGSIIKAKREVIVTAGAIISPKILMLSGVGEAEHLQAMGIKVESDLPGVGENYQDHLVAPVDGKLNQPLSLLGQDKGLTAAKHGLNWLFRRKGLLSSNLVETGGFFDLDGDGRPEIQIHTLGMASTSWGKLADEEPVHGYSVAPCCLTSYSRGQIRLRSGNASDHPVIYCNYLKDPRDLENLKRGVRFARRILKTAPLSNYIESEIMPGAQVLDDDAALEQYIRDNVQMAFHPAGTCAMGNGDMSVVDARLCVRGIKGLRVADASVMPTLIRGNTTAPTVMIAERAADFIRMDHA